MEKHVKSGCLPPNLGKSEPPMSFKNSTWSVSAQLSHPLVSFYLRYVALSSPPRISAEGNSGQPPPAQQNASVSAIGMESAWLTSSPATNHPTRHPRWRDATGAANASTSRAKCVANVLKIPRTRSSIAFGPRHRMVVSRGTATSARTRLTW